MIRKLALTSLVAIVILSPWAQRAVLADAPQAARLPRKPRTLRLEFAPALGLNPGAAELVFERVYPSRWVSPALFKSGDSTGIPLQGFETAIYEVYPLADAREPLVAGTVFRSVAARDGSIAVDIYEAQEKARLLNPDAVREAGVDGKRVAPGALAVPVMTPVPVVSDVSLGPDQKSPGGQRLKFKVAQPAAAATLAVLLTPEPEFRGQDLPDIEVTGNIAPGQETVEKEKGSWAWHKLTVGPGDHDTLVRFVRTPRAAWRGRAAFWLITSETRTPTRIDFRMRQQARTVRSLPPLPFPPGVFSRTTELGAVSVKLGS